MLPLWESAENSVCIVRLTEPEEIAALISLFETVAQKENWQPGNALRLWLDRSIYFALEMNGQLVGGLQLVLPDLAGSLPCKTVWPEVPKLSSHAAHIAILALDETVRGHSILFWLLAVEMWRYCVTEGIALLFIEVTPRVLPLYRRLGWPLVVQGELRLHWGEDCLLCTLGVPEVASALLQRAERSQYYRQIVSQAFRLISSATGSQSASTQDS